LPACSDPKQVLTVPASLDRLPQIQRFVLEQAHSFGLSGEACRRLSLVLEEMVVNVIQHAYGQDRGELEVHCRRTGSDQPGFCVTLVDHGCPFDPLRFGKPDMKLGIDDRPVGGLGIFLAREMADKISYIRRGRANRLTFCFDLPGS
jgi:anti-sigma regulatory factor (Ser/Thr protein kinase)